MSIPEPFLREVKTGPRRDDDKFPPKAFYAKILG